LEITQYLSVHRDQVDEVLETLSYVDGVTFARRATAPAFFSVALMDPICPPSLGYAAYNHCASTTKEIAVYRYNGHEGGESRQRQAQIRWLGGILGRA